MHATSSGQLWHQVITAGPPPSLVLVVATGLAALVLVGSRRLWPLTRTVVTIAHEGGHALVALAV
ncbi:MAG TPA: M50 family metallopeptidase, partial [Streptosporangiaceae bacterium]|nr:M50 family metallopeptidase [Streptosporangiaceae bacterium]